ncbi:hypothetical protein CH373_12905 [Leptospira perolatii]|uniref:Uncharacterized protein n=1 Tax=Leptospira perolatii TaxID=2023191 RepID=A0A2M9ZKN6_9LEPT|nr:hypothetical protein [Leptospira perolatii]PJZ69984.1 hypothetical protein CH360_08780 [Leptospira perolatii]PJZ72608.1 hypothetical protein CH373_12905 [Leptospira perolatii]
MKRVPVIAGAILLLFFARFLPAEISGPPDEEKAKKELQLQWSKRFPGDKILSSELTGEPKLVQKENPEEGSTPEMRYKFSFLVTAKKKEGQTTRTEVSVNYQFNRIKGWYFTEMGMGRSMLLTEPGKEPPEKEEAYQMIEASILEEKGANKTVDSIRLSEPEFGQNLTLSKEKFWYRYEGEYELNDGNQKMICSEFVVRLFKEANAQTWKIEWRDKGKCKVNED